MLIAGLIAVAALIATPARANPACAAIDTVFTIVLENENAADVLNDPYFGQTLPAKGYLLTNMNGVSHPSQPNYIAMISGSTYKVTGDGNVDLTGKGKTIVELVEAKGLTWKAYMEDYPAQSAGKCYTGSFNNGDNYARKHNPFVSFYNSDKTRCNYIVPATNLASDESSGALANYVFYTPNQQNDGHDTDIPTASNWLQSFLEPKLTKAAYAKTLFVITFDESASTSPNSIYTVLIGAGINGAGLTDGTSYSHYSTLATIEKVFGLGNLGLNDVSASTFPLNCGSSNPTTSSSSSSGPTTTSSSSSSSAPTTTNPNPSSSSSASSKSSSSASATTSCTKTVLIKRGGGGGPSSSTSAVPTTTIITC